MSEQSKALALAQLLMLHADTIEQDGIKNMVIDSATELVILHEEINRMNVNPNNTKQALEYLRQLRKMGYAVVAFTPEELRGANPDHVEDRLIEYGWDIIHTITEDIESERLVKPSDEDWNWSIK